MDSGIPSTRLTPSWGPLPCPGRSPIPILRLFGTHSTNLLTGLPLLRHRTHLPVLVTPHHTLFHGLFLRRPRFSHPCADTADGRTIPLSRLRPYSAAVASSHTLFHRHPQLRPRGAVSAINKDTSFFRIWPHRAFAAPVPSLSPLRRPHRPLQKFADTANARATPFSTARNGHQNLGSSATDPHLRLLPPPPPGCALPLIPLPFLS